MKLYFLNNMYCMGQQAGIQALHAGMRLIYSYQSNEFTDSECQKMVNDWYHNHETVVLLNAGNSTDLSYYLSLIKMSSTVSEQLPYSFFNEPGLNDSLTSIAVLCSTEMVEDMKDIRENYDDVSWMSRLSEKYGPSLFELLSSMSRMRTI